MVLTESLDILEIKLGDTLNKEFPPALKLSLLNIAQSQVVELLNRHVLEELDAVALAKALDSEGKFDLTTLDVQIFRNNKAIDGIRITGGHFCNKLSFFEYRKYVDMDKTFNSREPIYYLRGKYLYVEPFTSGETTIDLYYMGEPVKMVSTGGSVSAAATANGGLKTAFTSTAHGLSAGDTVVHSTFTVPSYNGTFVIESVTTDTYTIVVAYVSTDTGLWDRQVDCELDDEVLHVIIKLAAKIGFDSVPVKSEFYRQYRQKVIDLHEEVYNDIEQINEKYPPTDSVTYGKNRFQDEDIRNDETFIIRTSQYIP